MQRRERFQHAIYFCTSPTVGKGPKIIKDIGVGSWIYVAVAIAVVTGGGTVATPFPSRIKFQLGRNNVHIYMSPTVAKGACKSYRYWGGCPSMHF